MTVSCGASLCKGLSCLQICPLIVVKRDLVRVSACAWAGGHRCVEGRGPFLIASSATSSITSVHSRVNLEQVLVSLYIHDHSSQGLKLLPHGGSLGIDRHDGVAGTYVAGYTRYGG